MAQEVVQAGLQIKDRVHLIAGPPCCMPPAYTLLHQAMFGGAGEGGRGGGEGGGGSMDRCRNWKGVASLKVGGEVRGGGHK